MRLRFFALLSAIAALCLPPVRAMAQAGFLPVSGTLTNPDGTSVSSATVCGQVTIGGVAATVQVGGGGNTTVSQVCANVIGSSWQLKLPDMSLTTPKYACVSITATDNISGNALIGAGFSCVQPRSVAPPNVSGFWCTAYACNFDQLPPYYPANVVMVAPQGIQGIQGVQGVPGTGTAATGNTGDTQIRNSGGNIAPSDKTTLLNAQPIGQFTEVGRKPLAQWLQSLHGGGTVSGIAHLVVIGDSYAICAAGNHPCNVGPSVSTHRWVEQLRIALQNRFGYAGTGMMPLSLSIGGLYINPDNYPATTGTLDKNTGTLGPSQSGMAGGNALVHLPDGASITFQPASNIGGMAYDHLHVYCMTTSSSGSLTAVIDGGASTSIPECSTTSSSPTAVRGNIIHLAPTVHTTVITSHGDSYLYALEGTFGSTGVEVSNLGFGGSDTTGWGSNAAAQLAFSDLNISGTQGVIVALQTNDILHGTPLATFSGALANVVAHELALSSKPSVGLFIPPVSSASGTYTAAQYTALQMALYQAQPIDVLNMQWQTGTAYDATSGLWFSDGIHPNDRLDMAMGAMVLQRWVDAPSVLSRGISSLSTVIPAGDFALSETRLGQFAYFPNGGTIVAMSVSSLGYTCSVPPVITIADCATDGNTGICSTPLASITVPSTNVNFSAPYIPLPQGHWIGEYISAGTCSVAPTIRFNATIQDSGTPQGN